MKVKPNNTLNQILVLRDKSEGVWIVSLKKVFSHDR